MHMYKNLGIGLAVVLLAIGGYFGCVYSQAAGATLLAVWLANGMAPIYQLAARNIR